MYILSDSNTKKRPRLDTSQQIEEEPAEDVPVTAQKEAEEENEQAAPQEETVEDVPVTAQKEAEEENEEAAPQEATAEDVPVTAQQKDNEEENEEAPPQEATAEDAPVTAQQTANEEADEDAAVEHYLNIPDEGIICHIPLLSITDGPKHDIIIVDVPEQQQEVVRKNNDDEADIDLQSIYSLLTIFSGRLQSII